MFDCKVAATFIYLDDFLSVLGSAFFFGLLVQTHLRQNIAFEVWTRSH